MIRPAGRLKGQAMSQLSQITQQNASASEELAATAEEMSGQAINLKELMAFFTLAGQDNIRVPDAPEAKPKNTVRQASPMGVPTTVPVASFARKGNGSAVFNAHDFTRF